MNFPLPACLRVARHKAGLWEGVMLSISWELVGFKALIGRNTGNNVSEIAFS